MTFPSPFTEPRTRGEVQPLADQLRALADPSRLQILSLLAANPDGLCVIDFVKPLDRSQPTCSHHLRLLVEAGLVDVVQQGVWRIHQLNPATVRQVAEALTPPKKGRRR